MPSELVAAVRTEAEPAQTRGGWVVMFIVPLAALIAVLSLAAVFLFSGHIPIVRELTGAAPLETEDTDPAPLLAGDASAEQVGAAAYAVDVARGLAETPDQWAARTGNQTTPKEGR